VHAVSAHERAIGVYVGPQLAADLVRVFAAPPVGVQVVDLRLGVYF